MESTLFLRNGPLPSVPLRISSPLSATRLTKPNFSSNHSSLSLPNSSYRRPLRHAFSPIVCAVNKFPTPSTNDESDSKIVRGTVGVSLVLACVLGIISCRMSPMANAATLMNQRKSPIVPSSDFYPAGGGPAMKSFLDTSAYLASRLTESKKTKLFAANKRPSAQDVQTLKDEAMELMKSKKADEVVKELQEAYKFLKNDPEPAFYVEMTLVEVLIYLGKYEEALECKCLKKPAIKADARVPLYKAIIYTLMNEKESARECWTVYIKAIEEGLPG
ncbi:hypothetical protein ACB098_05G125200 [Castanea mollissima]|uniref:Uncharacterized protein n=1 Tax=Castanea mollissima TaxID=60419 RepID=A0A8J4RUB9_9ROSI|nr:hypothetical protein CMV_007071 [Castanea mollissima]